MTNVFSHNIEEISAQRW